MATSIVTVPNGKIANARIDNFGKRTARLYKTVLGLTYDTSRAQIETYMERLRSFLGEQSDVAEDMSYEVQFYSFGDNALEILVQVFFDVPGRHEELEARTRCNEGFMRIAEETGVSFAFPSTSVYIESMPK